MRKKIYLLIFPLMILFVGGLFVVQAQEDDAPTPSPFDPSQFQEKRMELKNEDLLMKCKDLADDSEECTRIRDFAFSTLKQNLDQMLNGLERHLLRMLDMAVENGSMTQEEADEIIGEFEVVVEELETEFERSESAEDLQSLVQGYRRQARYRESFPINFNLIDY